MPRPRVLAKRVTRADGLRFDSQGEADWYAALEWRQKAGEISALEHQPVLRVMSALGREVCKIKPDAAWIEGGKRVYADYKAFSGDTAVSRLKRKIAWAIMDIEIEWHGPAAKPLRVKREKKGRAR